MKIRAALLVWWWGPGWILGVIVMGVVGLIEGERSSTMRADFGRITTCWGPLGAFFARRGWAGVTIGHDVLIWGQTMRATLIEHEARHVRQWDRWGWLFPIAYLACLARYGYRANPFEVAARGERHA